MSSSSLLLRRGLIAVALLGGSLSLAGCTSFRPVYGDNGVVQQRLEVAYSKPGTRLDQIIIQDLSLKLGKSDNPDAPLITISSGVGNRTVTRTGTSKPATQQEATVNVSYTVAADGRVVTFGSRSASASWTTTGQVLGDEAAYRDAQERAARAAAETVRLSILSALAKPVRPDEADPEVQ